MKIVIQLYDTCGTWINSYTIEYTNIENLIEYLDIISENDYYSYTLGIIKEE